MKWTNFISLLCQPFPAIGVRHIEIVIPLKKFRTPFSLLFFLLSKSLRKAPSQRGSYATILVFIKPHFTLTETCSIWHVLHTNASWSFLPTSSERVFLCSKYENQAILWHGRPHIAWLLHFPCTMCGMITLAAPTTRFSSISTLFQALSCQGERSYPFSEAYILFPYIISFFWGNLTCTFHPNHFSYFNLDFISFLTFAEIVTLLINSNRNWKAAIWTLLYYNW